jgi:magnesium-transporting ATPase (P-type)
VYDKDLHNSEYIYYNKDNTQPFALSFFQLFASYFILFNNIIPISLTITFEVAKGVQVAYIDQDPDLRLNGENFKILSLKLQEDLGNVKYLFTDKTGTLTKNEMEFKACSIFTKLFEEDISISERPSIVDGRKSIFSQNFDKTMVMTSLQLDSPLYLNTEHDYIKSSRDALLEFFLNITLNQNVLIETDSDIGQKSFQGPSPDEVALVQAASEIGIEFMSRVGKEITIAILGEEVKFEILQRFDFTSERGRSSVIVKNSANDEIKLYMKGADNVILKNIDYYSINNLLPLTKEHLDKFAKLGLRTLCYSSKIISNEEYENWKVKYDDIKYKAFIDKSVNKELEAIISDIENNSLLLGVSGLEDKLQDNVKNTIQEFIEAEINVWMITGDKLDTAESIGYSSQLFNDDTEVYKLTSGTSKEELKEKIDNIIKEIADLEKEVIRMKLARRKKKTKKSFNIEMDHIISRRLSVIKEEHDRKYTVNENGEEKEEIKSQSPKRKESKNRDHSSSFTKNVVPVENVNYSVDELPPINLDNIQKRESNKSFDDISVIKFMMDKKFFEGNNGNGQKTFENLTFMKNILVIKDDSKKKDEAGPRNGSEDSCDTNKQQEIKLNFDNEHVDLANLYDFYQKEVRRIDSKKKESKKILKYMNFNFNELKKRKSCDENEKEEYKHKKMINFGLIIEGEAINHCIDPEIAPLFYKLIKKANSIICCRCNPIQKSEIVSFVKHRSGEVCLAVGDGGNDVNMIKTANVGVGIFGKEGYQAAYNSDYSISQFQHLKRLMFYHGRYSLLRNSYFIYFFFYKSIIFCATNLWFAFFCGFSGTDFWDDMYFILYSSILTTMPPVVVMVYYMDIDLDFPNYKNKETLKW